MNKSDLHKNIIKEIQELYSFVNRFENPNQVHQIDIDLAMSKVRNLYDILLKLNSQESYISEYHKEEKSTIHKQSEKEDNVKEKNVSTNKPVIIEKTLPEPEIIFEKNIKKEEIKKGPVVDEEKQKKVNQKKQDSTTEIIADRFQSKTFMHDTISKGKTDTRDVSSKMKSKPIKDINSAIGLNDKFVFIRELFNGNKEQFSETIQLLNNFDTFENAIGFLKDNFKWDFEEATVEKLVELVHRKYTSS
ncbi:MAG: hypothetical protein A2X13_13985 [Bacteroidetes bacterium GWC2_33_15]|nr:MAG: hypothetical protein A2X10_09200 [Bacteroidetes bacterium GWA2_33_15]OFX50453.1 MAG: hypothetical protein A2X13_13985 [Bacteroidetes bacterium GWC2_33_15]OFX66629.1 MAG: hypothetical protein A2X15_07890 [Bacteroidetes bacterium GWB2_32_14]OFX69247.1 MAG: hypothetical protein A2X14_08820 [Bacteroidetes bacterium GWD2_33_33]HAN18560.1 hypothetical protein [Bacteroidales bacterium]